MAPILGFAVNEIDSVVQLNVYNEFALPLVEEILKARGIDFKNGELKRGKFDEFEYGTDEFLALLGCPNGKGVAFFLFTNRPVLGWKTVEVIKIWGGYVLSLPP